MPATGRTKVSCPADRDPRRVWPSRAASQLSGEIASIEGVLSVRSIPAQPQPS